ncbi:hypothetical protein P691DRAFT_766064 [Macrolepiota fuliginosa MF-IS2]|uniref:Uncharacterized protein n=1 Tax=Macrolepiota fuliginosa MF-IS2 TaxID=1400762 RepID=A0A9P6BXM5_9AGAR|nr:hypothetical protein P691DRAFT_766064 [Macrolepiota fuliginosa MF-IS2]
MATPPRHIPLVLQVNQKHNVITRNETAEVNNSLGSPNTLSVASHSSTPGTHSGSTQSKSQTPLPSPIATEHATSSSPPESLGPSPALLKRKFAISDLEDENEVLAAYDQGHKAPHIVCNTASSTSPEIWPATSAQGSQQALVGWVASSSNEVVEES